MSKLRQSLPFWQAPDKASEMLLTFGLGCVYYLGMHVLIVDDDDTDERLPWFVPTLESFGYTVSVARTPGEAFELFTERSFDLVFFDHDLGIDPDGSGIAGRVLYHPEQYHAPRAAWVHSMNSTGALNIASKFHSADIPVKVDDFGNIRNADPGLFRAAIESLVPRD